MTKWMEKLSGWQKVALAAFFGLLGVVLWTLPFYLGGREMISPTGVKSEWTEVHWFFLLFGTIAIGLSLKLSRLDKLFNLGTGFLSKFAGAKKNENNG